MSRSVNVRTYIDVDVDLEDIDTDDLLKEIEERDLTPPGAEVSFFDAQEMFYAFKLGKEDRAMELAKKIAQDCAGRIL